MGLFNRRVSNMRSWPVLIVSLVAVCAREEVTDYPLGSRCIIQACSGCQLDGNPEMDAFLFEDFELKYENTKLRKVSEKKLEATFYNYDKASIEKIDIRHMTRKEMNALMISQGVLPKKPKKTQIVRDEI